MNEKNKKMELLARTPVPRALIAMGIPTMAGMLISAVYNLVDAYFVGGLGTSQMAAISVVFPLSQVIVGLGLLFGNGAASSISRLLGRGDTDTADRTASTALYGSITVGTVIIILTLIFLHPVLILLGATASILPYATAYAGIFIASSVFSIFNVTMNNLVTSEGSAKTTMCTLLTGAVLNIFLDPVFIYTLHMGVGGAATATAVSRFISSLLYLGYIFGKKSVFSFSVKKCCYSKEILSEIMKIGVPTLIFQLLTSLSITLINIQSKKYGDSVIAGMGAVTRIIAMGSLVVFGFIKGFQPIAGYSYGAKKYARLQESVKLSVLWSTLFCALFGFTAALFPSAIISLFTKGDREMIAAGRNALRANGLSFILFGFYTVYSSLFLSLGKAKAGFFLGACRQGICFIPVILMLPLLFGKTGIFFAQPAADVLSAFIAVLMARRLHRRLAAEQAVLS
jgi:putative MATE family efflux protein